jgi:hypothetical protein
MENQPISSKTEDAVPPKRRLSRQAKEFTPILPKPQKPVKPFTKKPPINMKQMEQLYIKQLGMISKALGEENKYVFKNQFLRLEEYSNLESVRRCFDPLEFVNESSLKLEELQQSRGVVIRSKTYDDIHKAMKYGVWTSTYDKNLNLNEIYKECVKNKQRLLLFFRVVKDNLFCGVAEVVSPYIEEQKFNLWWENQRYRGIFNTRWIYVKNLSLNTLNLREQGVLLRDLRDGDSLGEMNKNKLLMYFKNLRYSYDDSVFKFFKKFDEREDQLISNRTVLDFEFKLQKTERKERGRRRKCSLIEGRSFKKEQSAKNKEEVGQNKKEVKEKNEKNEENKDVEKHKRKRKKNRKKRDRKKSRKEEEEKNQRRRKKKDYDEEYYDRYYYDEYSYDEDYYGDGYNDDYYYNGYYDDDGYYYDDYYNDKGGYVRKDEAEKKKSKRAAAKKKRRRNRKKKAKAQGETQEKKEEVKEKTRASLEKKNKKKKDPKKKYIMVKEPTKSEVKPQETEQPKKEVQEKVVENTQNP